MNLPISDFSFLENPIVIGAKNEVYCLLPDFGIHAVAGFGEDQPLKALQFGSSPLVNWLLTDQILLIFNRSTGVWQQKDISSASIGENPRVCQAFDVEQQIFWLTICGGNDLYTLSVSEREIREHRIAEPLQAGFMVPYIEEISYFGRDSHNKGELLQTVVNSVEGEGVSYPLFDVNNDSTFLAELGRLAGVKGQSSFSSSLKIANITDCSAGLASQTEHILLLVIENNEQPLGLALVSIDADNNKHVLQFFKDMTLINQLEINEALVFFYLSSLSSADIACIKYDNGQIQWADCILAGYDEWPGPVRKFSFADDVGVYALVEGSDERKSIFVTSNDALDFGATAEL